LAAVSRKNVYKQEAFFTEANISNYFLTELFRDIRYYFGKNQLTESEEDHK